MFVQSNVHADCEVFAELGLFFSTDAQSWVNLQTHFDTEAAREVMGDAIARIQRFEPATA